MTAEGFYRRPLPEAMVAFASEDGRRLFREALDAGGLEGWFALAEQFHTQSDPAYCGLGTLVMVLNALAIDPGRAWKGPWRWFSEELLDCCRPLSVVRARGITLDEFACLARCNGATARRVRATDSSEEAFRAIVREASATPGEPFLAVAYSRQVLGQTGGGHFSPVAGYHAGRDLALLLDAARFKYPPHWVPVSLLWRAQLPEDPTTGRSRGHVVLGRSAAAPNPFFCRIALEHHDWPAVARTLTEARCAPRKRCRRGCGPRWTGCGRRSWRSRTRESAGARAAVACRSPVASRAGEARAAGAAAAACRGPVSAWPMPLGLS